MDYTVSNTVPWIMTDVTSGSSTGETDRVNVSYSTSGLDGGVYNAQIYIWGREHSSGTETVNSPEIIDIIVDVKPRAVLGCDTEEVSRTVRQGGNVELGDMNIRNESSEPKGDMSYLITSDAAWLRFSSCQGAISGSESNLVEITGNITGIAPGEHSAVIVITGTDEDGGSAVESPHLIDVQLEVERTEGLDFNGSGSADVVVYHRASGIWYILERGEGSWSEQFGGLSYKEQPGDFNGDGVVDLGVYRGESGYWYAKELGSDVIMIVGQWGDKNYLPIRGDFDGDYRDDFAIYERGEGHWYIMNPDGDIVVWALKFGGLWYEPLTGDFDGDGIDDLAVYNSNTGEWYVYALNGRKLVWGMQWGGEGFEAVVGDYDGDSLSDLGVYHKETGLWYIINIEGDVIVWGEEWGGGGFKPVVGDYDGDGAADLCVYYGGFWFIKSVSGEIIEYGLIWGSPACDPVGM
jgi:hypothetical protein